MGEEKAERKTPEWVLVLSVVIAFIVLKHASNQDAKEAIMLEGSGGISPNSFNWADTLDEAGIDTVEVNTFKKLPTIQTVEESYGKGPHIVGLERCADFRKGRSPKEAMLAIAGNFNTNTNHMYLLLEGNCEMPLGFDGVLWQVPWSKHLLAEHRSDYTAPWRPDLQETIDRNNVMPVVTVRDPYYWMQAMCRNKYVARFPQGDHCPYLVSKKSPQKGNEVTVRYDPEIMYTFDSLPDFWQTYNEQYYNAKYPRLIVRFEDIIYHPKEVTKQVCECAGGKLKKGPFQYDTDGVKKVYSSNATDWIGAVIKYSTLDNRLKGFQKEDLVHAKKFIDPKLLKAFQYHDIQV